ncbi:hypothetical protein C2S52_017125 [Perilla frutescens var. hirtella]|nr:hypothetical protein C2S52_017125 [Perilla frutescens var. hirtella]
MSYINKEELEKGDKIINIMPPSALDRLDYFEIEYPMLFHLCNPSSGKMMESMVVEQSGVVIVKNASLPKGTYVKLQPHTKDLLDVSNPRAILETTLRNYSCLTRSGTIVIDYNKKKFYIDILQTPPQQFGLSDQEPESKVMEFSAFTGSARCLDGKASTQQVEPVFFPKNDGSNDSTTKSGSLVFGSNGKQKPSKVSSENPTLKEENEFKAFTRRKFLLRG